MWQCIISLIVPKPLHVLLLRALSVAGSVTGADGHVGCTNFLALIQGRKRNDWRVLNREQGRWALLPCAPGPLPLERRPPATAGTKPRKCTFQRGSNSDGKSQTSPGVHKAPQRETRYAEGLGYCAIATISWSLSSPPHQIPAGPDRLPLLPFLKVVTNGITACELFLILFFFIVRYM